VVTIRAPVTTTRANVVTIRAPVITIRANVVTGEAPVATGRAPATTPHPAPKHPFRASPAEMGLIQAICNACAVKLRRRHAHRIPFADIRISAARDVSHRDNAI
jgi:hypothetical protein